MDEITGFNKERWEELAQSDVVFSRPLLDLDARSARDLLDPHNLMGDVTGRDVLCLASGGGQQSPAFALLGANVTVLDLSETQLRKDQEAAAHYGLSITAVQGDMRDLSPFADDAFDLVWHAFSINFVPHADPVWHEVARVLRAGGLYRIQFANPFTMGLDESDWNGECYPLMRPYIDGAEIDFSDSDWEIWYEDGSSKRAPGPREFRHALSSITNGLARLGFIILGMWEEVGTDVEAEPGTWAHLTRIAPPWITFWTAYRPDLLAELYRR